LLWAGTWLADKSCTIEEGFDVLCPTRPINEVVMQARISLTLEWPAVGTKWNLWMMIE